MNSVFSLFLGKFLDFLVALSHFEYFQIIVIFQIVLWVFIGLVKRSLFKGI